MRGPIMRYICTDIHTYVRDLECYPFTSTNSTYFEKDKNTEVQEYTTDTLIQHERKPSTTSCSIRSVPFLSPANDDPALA